MVEFISDSQSTGMICTHQGVSPISLPSALSFEAGHYVLGDLGSATLSVKIGIPVAVVADADFDNYVASFRDANLSASGDTMAEAIENLKDRLCGMFEHYSTFHRSRLGSEARRQLAVLREHIAQA